MIGLRELIATALVFFAIARSSGAAVPRESISIVFRDAEPVSVTVPYIVEFEGIESAPTIIRFTEPVTLRNHLAFGDMFWESSRRLRICSDAYIAESIDTISQFGSSARILLDVPGRTTLSTAAAAIEGLKSLAAEYAIEGCKVEIIVFPTAGVTTAPALVAAP